MVRGGLVMFEDGLPIGPGIKASKRSMILRLLASTGMVPADEGRLWARAFNDATEETVSQALKKARGAKTSKPRPTDQRLAAPSPRNRKEWPLLQSMGLVFPGSGSFLQDNGYVLWPSDSAYLVGNVSPRPFGVLAHSGHIHLFVSLPDLRLVSRPLNDLIPRLLLKYDKAHFSIHILWHGVPPPFDEGRGENWPLVAWPSFLWFWHQPDLRQSHLGQVQLISASSSALDRKEILPRCRTWKEWKSRCVTIEAMLAKTSQMPFHPIQRVLPSTGLVKKKLPIQVETASGNGAVMAGTNSIPFGENLSVDLEENELKIKNEAFDRFGLGLRDKSKEDDCLFPGI